MIRGQKFESRELRSSKTELLVNAYLAKLPTGIQKLPNPPPQPTQSLINYIVRFYHILL